MAIHAAERREDKEAEPEGGEILSHKTHPFPNLVDFPASNERKTFLSVIVSLDSVR